MRDRLKASAVTFAVVASMFAVGPMTASAAGNYCGNFIDVAGGSSLCDAVSYVRNRAIFDGYNIGSFQPQQNINRAEVLKVVMAAFLNEKFDLSSASQNSIDGRQLGFKDIPAGTHDWWYVYLNRAKQIGFIQGYADGTFRATNNVSRVEFLKMFLYLSPNKSEVDHWNINPSIELWADTPASAWYAKYVAFANHYGLFGSFNYCSYGNICPNTAITRGEVAQLIYNYHNAFHVDVGFPKAGFLTNIYAQATLEDQFHLSSVPSNAVGAFKLPSSAFDVLSSAQILKNVDCSQPSPNINSTSTFSPWSYFYTSSSNWKDPNTQVDFYFSDPNQGWAYLYGPFHDSLQNVLQDIITSRCIDGTFGAANYSGIPAQPVTSPTPTPTPTPVPTPIPSILTAPTLTSPTSGFLFHGAQTINFAWTPVSGASYYQIQIRDAASSSYFFNQTSTSASYSSYQNVGNTQVQYYWRVMAFDASGRSVTSQEFTYSLTPSYLTQPALISPSSGTTFHGSQTINLSWTPVNSATYYQVQIRDGGSSTYFYNQISNTNSYSFWANTGSSPTPYYWRVMAFDGKGNSSTSSESSYVMSP